MGEGGFEPPTTWSQTRNHTKLDHPPFKIEQEFDNLRDSKVIKNHKMSTI